MSDAKLQIEAIQNLIYGHMREISKLEMSIKTIQDNCNHIYFTSFEDCSTIVDECSICGISYEVSLVSYGEGYEE